MALKLIKKECNANAFKTLNQIELKWNLHSKINSWLAISKKTQKKLTIHTFHINSKKFFQWFYKQLSYISRYVWSRFKLTIQIPHTVFFCTIVSKGGGGCGRFWNLPILVICSLYKSLWRISFCMVSDKCMLLILLQRIFV